MFSTIHDFFHHPIINIYHEYLQLYFSYFTHNLATRTNFSKSRPPLGVTKVNAFTVLTDCARTKNNNFGWFTGVT